MKFSLSDDESLWSSRLAALKALATSRVDVGLTSSASARSRMLLAIHEHGAPAMRIPPRTVIEPALSFPEARDEMTAAMQDALAAAMAGAPDGATAALNRAGESGVAAIRRYIDAGVPPPNAPVTVSGGWIYNRIAKKGDHVQGKGFNKPIYDTGELYNDFDYEIKGRGD